MAKHETSITYQWRAGDGALIDHIEMVRQKNGRSVAYIHANEDPALHGKRQDARSAMRLKGWGTLSDFRENRFVLRVNGFASDGELISLLQDLGYTKGAPQIQYQAAEKEKPQGFIDGLRTNSLRASGIFYSLGNMVYLASGILRSKERGKTDYGQIQSALTWGAGDILVATIGGKDDGRQLTSLLTKLKRHYVREGIDIPITAAIHSETSVIGKGLGSKIYDFTHEYLNQIKCLTETAAAFGYYKAGKDQGNFPKQVTAVTFGLGFLASALIPEKKIDPEQYENAGSLGRLWMRIRANPLSVGGLSGYSNTILTSYSAFDEGRRLRDPLNHPAKINLTTGLPIKPSKYYKLDYAAPAVMFFGNGLYALSNKTTGGDIRTDAMVRDVYSISAQILNKLPEGERERALESTTRFLGERPEVRDTTSDVRRKLKEAMAIQQQNPWFEKIQLPLPMAKLEETPVAAPAVDAVTPDTPIPVITEVEKHRLKDVGSSAQAANDAQHKTAAIG